MTRKGPGHKVDPKRKGLPSKAPAGMDFEETEAGSSTERNEMDETLAKSLKGKEVQGPIDLAKLVDGHYKAAKELTPLWRDDTKYPSIKDVKKALASITPKQLEVINQMEVPILQLMPIVSGQRYLADLDASSKDMRGHRMPDWTKEALKRADRRDNVSGEVIKGWRVAITEGARAPKLLDGDDTRVPIRERYFWFAKVYGSKGVTGVDIKGYAKLQQAGFAKERPRPIDGRAFTIVDDDHTLTILNEKLIGYENPNVASHLIASPTMFLRWDSLHDFQRDRTRFRPSVVVDVQ